METKDKIVWEHNGDTTAYVEVAQEPIKVLVQFCDHSVVINGVTIKLDTLKQIIANWDDNSRAASKMMEPPF